jgi:biotin carboxylase
VSRRPVVIFLNLRRTALEHGAAIDAADRLGYDVALVADTVPPDLPRGKVPVVHHVNTYDQEAVDRAVDAIGAECTIAGVVTWSDRDVEAVSRIAQRLRLPAPSMAAAGSTRNKYLMREGLRTLPWTTPSYARVVNEEDLGRAVAEIGYPAVLKPTSASGSRGIFIVRDQDELSLAYKNLVRYARPEVDKVFTRYPGELIYEELLVGTEHSVEGFVSHGEITIVGVTDKETTEPFRLEVGHIYPSSLSGTALKSIESLTVTVVNALGLDHCAFHLECMLRDDGSAKLVEVAARTGGDFIASNLVELATGTSFCENVIRIATGQRPVPHDSPTRYAGIRKIMAERAGVFKGLVGVERARRLPGVAHLVVERQPGATVRLPPDDYLSSTLGVVIGVGASAAAVQRSLRQAVGTVSAQFDQE